jgi:hypothetical protein
MVKTQEKDTAKSYGNQGLRGHSGKAVRIGPSTAYSYCSERLSAFGGLLGLMKFMDAVQFEELFTRHYIPPGRTARTGALQDGVWDHYTVVHWVQPDMAFSVPTVRLDAVWDLWGGQASLCDNVLEVRGLIGDQPREVAFKGYGGASATGMAGMRDTAYVGAYEYGHNC